MFIGKIKKIIILIMEIWYKNIVSFFSPDNVLDFIPSSKMNYTEKLNTILRLSLYISIVSYLATNDFRSIGLFVIVAIVTFFMNHVDENTEKYQDTMFTHLDNDNDNDNANVSKRKILKKKCTKPTKENPFMNVMMNEYSDNPQRDAACDVSEVHKYVDEYFNEDLFRSVDDIYNKNSSVRQYYTTPNTTIPNDQEGFANWLYKFPEKTCKEGNGEKCKYFS
jgi:hypothetical protein